MSEVLQNVDFDPLKNPFEFLSQYKGYVIIANDLAVYINRPIFIHESGNPSILVNKGNVSEGYVIGDDGSIIAGAYPLKPENAIIIPEEDLDKTQIETSR